MKLVVDKSPHKREFRLQQQKNIEKGKKRSIQHKQGVMPTREEAVQAREQWQLPQPNAIRGPKQQQN